MRWVILTDDFLPMVGGVAMMAAAIAGGLHARGHEVTVYARKRSELKLEVPYKVVGVGGPSFGRFGGVWLARRAWRDCLTADGVIGLTWPVSSGLAWAIQRKDLPFHVFFHGSEVTSRPWKIRSFRKVCERSTHRWAVSDYLVGLLAEQGIDSNRIPIPIDTSALSTVLLPETPRDWLLVARATPLKGGERFLRLVAAAGAKATIVGDGPYLERWRQLAGDLSLGGRVVFTGALRPEEVRSVMEEHDLCMLLPTVRSDGTGAEGLGICLLEAALAGMAVVGCRVGGVPEATGAGLVLTDPDDIESSIAQIRAWWNVNRGQECAQWVATHHGLSQTLDDLLGA